MPDRTKMIRSNAIPNPPKYIEGGQGAGDILRTDLPDQKTEIDHEWGTPLLQSIPLDSPANNQYAGPAARPMYYRPDGKASVSRPGLDDGDDVRGVDGHAMKQIAPNQTSSAPRAHKGRNPYQS